MTGVRICPACKRVLPYDPDTWGNLLLHGGPIYVCPGCRGTGAHTQERTAGEQRERDVARLRAQVEAAEDAAAEIVVAVIDLLRELPAELPAKAGAARTTLRLVLDRAEDHVDRAQRRAQRGASGASP